MLQVTVSNLGDLADSLGVPHMPRLPSLSNMSFTDVITQWVVAKQFSMPVATVRLPESKLRSLQQLIPNFSVPLLVVSAHCKTSHVSGAAALLMRASLYKDELGDGPGGVVVTAMAALMLLWWCHVGQQ
jgi:hypothetical protein